MSSCSMMITVLSIWHAWSHFIPTTPWWRYYYPYFAHDETEALPCYIICLKPCEGAGTQAQASLTRKPGTRCVLCLDLGERGILQWQVTCQSALFADATWISAFLGAKRFMSFKNETPKQKSKLSCIAMVLETWETDICGLLEFMSSRLAWFPIVRSRLKNKWIWNYL